MSFFQMRSHGSLVVSGSESAPLRVAGHWQAKLSVTVPGAWRRTPRSGFSQARRLNFAGLSLSVARVTA